MKQNHCMGNMLLMIGIGCFLVAGLVLLGICIFSDQESKVILPIALGCTVGGNVLNFIRNRFYPKQPKNASDA